MRREWQCSAALRDQSIGR